MKTLLQATDKRLDCWTDEDLLIEYRLTGNRELFEVLVHRYEEELYRFLYRKTHSRETAEDVFQTTFLQVHLKSEQFEAGRAFRPWLYRIASNQAIDHRRRSRRHDAVRLDESYGGTQTDGETLSMILESADSSPVEQAELADDVVWLRENLRLLPIALREVVDLVCFRGMSYRQAAGELGIPFKTVATRLASAKKRLADAMAD